MCLFNFLTKRKISVLFVSAFLFSANFLLSANDFNIWIAPQYSLKNGRFNQTVMNKTGGNDKIITEQTFDEKYLSFIGLESGFAWRFISLQAAFNWGIPKKMGNMTEDHHNVASQNIINRHKEFETEYDSENFAVDANLVFDIPVIQGWLDVKPYAGFSYSFSKENAIFQSGRQSAGSEYYDYRLEKHPDKYSWEMNTAAIENGQNVWFKRELINWKIGAAVEGTFFDHFYVNVMGEVAPFSFLNSIYYNGTGAYYLDKFKSNFKWWSVGAGLGGRFGKNNCFELGLNWKMSVLPELEGTSYQSKNEKSDYKEYTDGTFAKTDFSNWQIGIYGKYNFTFGPTHMPRARVEHEKKEKAPKIRNGKVKVKVY